MPHAYQWDPCPWIGLLILLQDPIFPDLRCLLSSQRRTTTRCFSSFHTFSLETGYSSSTTADITTCRRVGWMCPFLSEGMRCITWNTRGLVGSVFSKQKNREFKLKYLKRLFDANILCLQEVHGKDECLQAISGVGSAISVLWYLST